MVTAAPVVQAVAPPIATATPQLTSVHQVLGRQQLQQISRFTSDQPSISQQPLLALRPCAALDTAAPDPLAQQLLQQHSHSDAANVRMADAQPPAASDRLLPGATGGVSCANGAQPVEVLNLALSDEDTQPLPDAVRPPQLKQHGQAGSLGDGSATAARAGSASHRSSTSGVAPSVGRLAAALGGGRVGAATPQRAEQPGLQRSQQQQQRLEASYLCTLQAAAAAPGAQFPLQLYVSGSVKGLAGRLQFRDPATGAPLPEYSIVLEVEDGSLAVHAALDHAVIQRWIGACVGSGRHALTCTGLGDAYVKAARMLLPGGVGVACPRRALDARWNRPWNVLSGSGSQCELFASLAHALSRSPAGLPPNELVQLLGQQPNGQQVARDKLGRLTRFLSDFIGVMHLELRHPQAPPIVLQMDAS